MKSLIILSLEKMKITLFYVVLCIVMFFHSCSTKEQFDVSESTVDCIRKFVDASLKNKFKKAEFYLSRNNLNKLLFDDWCNMLSKISYEDLQQYQKSSIVILKDSVINDTVSLVTFYNSYKKNPLSLRVVRVNGNFLIDLKHKFNSF